MIQSAMMFALGVFVSGLVSLALLVALVRRTRRVTERRLLAGIATRRAEFEAERDEMRARHAVQMHRLEREVSRVLDQATAFRLESDIKERDLVSARAEVEARDEELQEYQQRLAEERVALQDIERRHAEAGSALRAAQHNLRLEAKRRAMAEQAVDEAAMLADRRRLEAGALRAENEALRSVLAEVQPDAPILRVPAPPPTAEPLAAASSGAPLQPDPIVGEAEPQSIPQSASVVALPTRPRPAPIAAAEAANDRGESIQQLQHLAGEAHADLGRSVWRAPVTVEPKLPNASSLGEPETEEDGEAENRFIEALAKIRALKRAASQAGE